MTIVYDRFGVQVHLGEALDVMRTLPAESIEAIITDPPYGLAELPTAVVVKALTEWLSGNREYVPDGKGFMGRHWDRFVPPPALWDEAFRVLKPGGYLLCFAAPRTADLMGLSIRLAGFELRDSIDCRLSWYYGEGMVKSLDVSKDIDRLAGFKRESNGIRNPRCVYYPGPCEGHNDAGKSQDNMTYHRDKSAPVSAQARQWAGFGTGIKPAHETIIMVRKQFTGTVAANVLTYGCGALNINACRVAAGQDYRDKCASVVGLGSNVTGDAYGEWTGAREDSWSPEGRWPPNAVFVHSALVDPESGEVLGDACADGCVEGCVVAELDRQSGVTSSNGGKGVKSGRVGSGGIYGHYEHTPGANAGGFGDTGGASRFFPTFRHSFLYQPKASTAERPRVSGKSHSTVKPVALMSWLVRLAVPPGGTVLDPCAGTGTTGQAARMEGHPAILIDNDPEAMDWIRARLDALPKTEAPPAGKEPVESSGDLFEGTLFGEVS